MKIYNMCAVKFVFSFLQRKKLFDKINLIFGFRFQSSRKRCIQGEIIIAHRK